MKENNSDAFDYKRLLLRILEGILIGLGAVLPGVSGGVLCVVFGVYKPMMELLADPINSIKRYYATLLPLILGIGIGFLGVARILGVVLTKYPSQSVCLFVGLITGMLPSLFRQAGERGRNRSSYISMAVCFVVILALLLSLKLVSVKIVPNFGWYMFCGFCLVLSVIVPGMSSSTLLMPLGLYTPFVDGIGRFNFSVLIPAGIGALITLLILARAINRLFEDHFSVAFHGIVGIVTAATVVIIPFKSFGESVSMCLTNSLLLAAGIIAALLLDRFNTRVNRRMTGE